MPYPPTAQHAIRQGKVAATNLISTIKGEENRKKAFDYKTRGVLTLIGRRNGVGILLGYRVHGFTAWWFWRAYYLSNLPTVEKKLRVMVDWFVDLFFKRDVTRLKTPFEEMAIRSNAYVSKMMKLPENGQLVKCNLHYIDWIKFDKFIDSINQNGGSTYTRKMDIGYLLLP
jgi:hypothetical protein